MTYRLGLDVGTNSLGWAVLELDQKDEPCAIMAAGSRIFTDGRDPHSSATLAAERREARSARRRRDRYLQRRQFLLNELTKASLFPKASDEAARRALRQLNPLELRARLLTEKAADILADIKTRTDKVGEAISAVNIQPEYLIGRALFHLNQRRGFQSNSKDRNNKSDGAISTSIDETYDKLRNEGHDTIGAYLWSLNKDGKPSRARPRKKGGALADSTEAGVDHYDLYIQRDMLKDEFNKIWAAQARCFPQIMTNGCKERIRNEVIFHQRPLKAQDVGRCMYIENEDRGAKALPSIQHHRIYQDLNNLSWNEGYKKVRLKDRPNGYAKIEDMLLYPTNQAGQVKFDTMRRELKKLKVMSEPAGLSTEEAKKTPKFNLEKRDDAYLNGDTTTSLLSGKNSPIADKWQAWRVEEQDAFVETIIRRVPDEKRPDEERYQTDNEAIQTLCKSYQLDETDARKCVEFELPSGYADYSKRAAELITAKMKSNDRPTQREAVLQVAKAENDFRDPHDFAGKGDKDRLEYYGKAFQGTSHITRAGTGKPEDKWNDLKYWGGIQNPSVHIALNQIRQVVNEVIEKYGKPAAISIELGRNLPAGPKSRNKVAKIQREQRQANERDKRELKQVFKIAKPSGDHIRKLRLWKEAKRICPYCQQPPIGVTDLFAPNRVEIEHIIPKEMGGQDNWANLTIAHRKCNAEKGGRTPYEAFGDDTDCSKLPPYKHWRFSEDARKIWEKAYKGFLNRHLNDTRYIGRIAKAYLGEICPDRRIVVTTGGLVHHLRKYWHLDSILDNKDRREEERGTKNRNDHRHHAIDAIVVGMVTRSLIQRVGTILNNDEPPPLNEIIKKLLGQTKEEREHFLKEVKGTVDKIIVSHKPSHKKPLYMVDEATVTTDRSKAKLDKKGRPVKISTDGRLHRDKVYGGQVFRKGSRAKNEDFEQAINVEREGKTTRIKVIPVKDRKSGKFYKGYDPKDNWAMEIYKYPDEYPTNPKSDFPDWRKKCGRWEGRAITRFAANQPEFDPDDVKSRLPCPGASFVMRLQEDDLIEIDTEKGRQVMVVHQMTGAGFNLAPHNEANVAGRNNNKNVSGLYKGHEFIGKLGGRQNAKIIAVKASKNVSGTYQGEKFSGEIKKPKGEKVEKVVFNHNGDEKTFDLKEPELDWKYDDKEDFSDDAWKCVEGEFQISVNTPGLEWSPEDNFSFTFKSSGELQKLNARKVRISPTGQINYEKRRTRRGVRRNNDYGRADC